MVTSKLNMLSNQDEEFHSCYVGVDDFDVTNIQEALLFLTLFFIYAALIYQTIQNLLTLGVMSRLPNQCEKSLRRIKQMNIMIIVTASIELIQKLEQLIFYTIMHFNGRDMETLILSTKIYVILCQCKLVTHYILIIENAYLWYFAINTNHANKIYFKVLWKYITPAIFLSIYLFNIVGYLFCNFTEARAINQVSTTLMTMIIFFGSIWRANKYFNKDTRIPKSFKQQIRTSSYFLYFSIPFRITYFMFLWLDTDQLIDFKQYNYSDMKDDGYNWFGFLIVYQILVGFFPLWYLRILFTPKINRTTTRTQTEESTQIQSQPLIFSDKISIAQPNAIN